MTCSNADPCVKLGDSDPDIAPHSDPLLDITVLITPRILFPPFIGPWS